MFESKYSKLLTVILVVVIVGIIGLLGFLAYDYFQNAMITKDTSDFVDNFQGEVVDGSADNTDTENGSEEGENPFNQIKDAQTASSSFPSRVISSSRLRRGSLISSLKPRRNCFCATESFSSM